MANSVSFWVATYRTLWVAPPIDTFAIYSGCAYTKPSTEVVNTLPNWPLLTFVGVSSVSCVYWPVRELSL
jgi:hypothetical protein